MIPVPMLYVLVSILAELKLVNMMLRFVLDALRKAVDSNMYWFGIVALDRFKE